MSNKVHCKISHRGLCYLQYSVSDLV